MKRWYLLLLLSLLAGCALPPAGQGATLTPAPTLTPLPQPTATPLPPLTYFIESYVPRALAESWDVSGMPAANTASEADVLLGLAENSPLQWVYALAAPYPTILDEIPSHAITQVWRGQPSEWIGSAPLLITTADFAVFSNLWGEPLTQQVQVYATPTEVLEAAWQAGEAFALVPFEALHPRWKVLRVDGQSPYDKGFDAANYPLTVHFGFTLSQAARTAGQGAVPLLAGNRDESKMTVVLMTGTTALVRATAYTLNEKGFDDPLADIQPWLQNADIIHISNESSFKDDCPQPGPFDSSRRFCSDPAHVELFNRMGVDVVELSGNHLTDYDRESLQNTLRILDENNIHYYAAGLDAESARQPLLLQDHGNRLAFIGCNNAGPETVWALEDAPGVAQCDMPWLAGEVARLRSAGYQVIFTFQYKESLDYQPLPWEFDDFRAMAQAGAAVVSGSQAHIPRTMEFWGDSFIHYGLGNFIFDQMYELTNRQEFINRHIFYDGRYLGNDLLTAMLEDFVRPRPTTPQERRELLQFIFKGSEW